MFLILLNLEIYIQIYLLYCLFYSLISILFIFILQYFNEKNILFNNKIFFSILSNYIFLTINIILISLSIGALSYEFKERNEMILMNGYKYKKFILFIAIIYSLNLFTLVINILIFQAYKFFNEQNINNNSEQESEDSKSTTDDNNKNYNYMNFIFENNGNIYLQKSILENLYYSSIDSSIQTIQ